MKAQFMHAKWANRLVVLAILALGMGSCEKEGIKPAPVTPKDETPTPSAWSRVFTDEFTNTESWSNWTRTERFDYNSSLCKYVASNPSIASYDDKSCLVLTAEKSGEIWQSGHVKSSFSFKPEKNTEYHTSASIKLIANDNGTWKGFTDTYGVWPAFWTVQETSWPVNGEIDIMEGYSFGTYTKFASNLFYGTSSGTNTLGITCEKAYKVNEGWHVYDQYWKNVNGVVTITIQLDGTTVATYTNANNGNLKLENFGPHNIIFNVNVGATTWNAFDNSKINVFSKTMMWVDYVTVEKRTL